MKRLLTFLVVVALVACGTSVANASLLTNGNVDVTIPVDTNVGPPPFFQARPANWVYEGSRTNTGVYNDGLTSESFSGVAPTPVTTDASGGAIPDGCGVGALDCGVFFKPFNGVLSTGNYLTVHLYQDNPGTPGMKYILTGWAGAASNYSGLIPGSVTKSELALEFDNDNDRSNGFISTEILDLRLAGLGQNLPNPFGYDEYMVMAVAPDGTSVVRARMSMIDGYGNPAGGPHAYVGDDFTLICIPEPASVVLLGIALGLIGVGRRRSG